MYVSVYICMYVCVGARNGARADCCQSRAANKITCSFVLRSKSLDFLRAASVTIRYELPFGFLPAQVITPYIYCLLSCMYLA